MEDLFDRRARRRLGQLQTLSKKSKPFAHEAGFRDVSMDLAREMEERVVELEDLDARLNAEAVVASVRLTGQTQLSEMPEGAYHVPLAQAYAYADHIGRMQHIRALNLDALVSQLEGPAHSRAIKKMKADKARLTEEIGRFAATPEVMRAYQMHFAVRLPNLLAARRARKAEHALDLLSLREMQLTRNEAESGDLPGVDADLIAREKAELEAVMDRLLADPKTYFHYIRHHANEYQHTHLHQGRVRCSRCSPLASQET